MTQIAVYSGDIVIYWSSIIITLGVAACFALSFALYSSHGGSPAAMWAMLPLCVLLSVLLSRVIHWYCHIEQYSGLANALSDFSVGSFCLWGVIFGVLLSALIVRRLGLCDSLPRLLDSVAVGMPLCVAFIRLSALFDTTCRSKIIITSPLFQRLPFAAELTSASGVSEYRFATFFVEFLIMFVITLRMLSFYYKRRAVPLRDGQNSGGHAARLFLVFFSAVELVLDSTRYDASFFHFTLLKKLNPYAGFISLTQLIAAIAMLCVLIHYSRASLRLNRLRWYHWVMWGLYLAALVGVGVSEYFVQRHGDWFLGCYGAMSACCLIMTGVVYRMYLGCCANARRAARE